jgi:hypothetical protein
MTPQGVERRADGWQEISVALLSGEVKAPLRQALRDPGERKPPQADSQNLH